MALLKVNQLAVHFNQGTQLIHAVKEASFSIDQGETLALVGESGSGKSVTAHSVLGLLPSTAKHTQTSSIVFDGKELLQSELKELRQLRGNRIGMIFQEPLSSFRKD